MSSPMNYITLKTTYNIIQWIIRKKTAFPVGLIYFDTVRVRVTFEGTDVLKDKDIYKITEDFYPIIYSLSVIDVEKDYWTIQFMLK